MKFAVGHVDELVDGKLEVGHAAELEGEKPVVGHVVGLVDSVKHLEYLWMENLLLDMLLDL